MKPLASLQGRLALGLALGLTLLWLSSTLAAGLIVRHEFDEAFDSALQETAQRLLPLAVIDIAEHGDSQAARTVVALDAHDEFLTYVVRDAAGRVLLQSHDADLAAFSPLPSVGFHDTETHRIYGESAVSGTVIIEVAEPLWHRREAMQEAAMALFLPLLLLVPASLIAVWWIVRRSLRPLRDFRAEIEARGGADLSAVAAERLPAELGPVATALNRLLERLRRTLEAERGFAANSAHELRTPIAAALAQTQRLIATAPNAEVRQRAQQIETSLHSLANLSEKLLQLAKAEGGSLLAESPQALSTVLAHVVADMHHIPGAAERIRLVGASEGALVSHLDPDAFAILMRNLIENGLRHGAAAEPVEVLIADDRTLRVVNGGAVVAAGLLDRLKGRFARGETAAGGAGLGLAIADAIVRGAGGTLLALSPATGRVDGFEVVVTLPP